MNELDAEKTLYARFWNLLGDRQLMTVFEKYGPDAFRRSSVLEGFETFIKQHNFRGESIVEIGTLKGLTALVLARYFKRVVTIDVWEDPLKREIAQGLGVKNIAFITVRHNAEKAEVIQRLQFDAAYVDGDHKHDSESDFALVRRCRRVLFHDHWEPEPGVIATVKNAGGNVVTKNKWALWTAS